MYEARNHASAFLSEAKGKLEQLNYGMIDELVRTNNEIASKYKILKDAYPYMFELKQSEQCAVILREIMGLERGAMERIKGIYEAL